MDSLRSALVCQADTLARRFSYGGGGGIPPFGLKRGGLNMWQGLQAANPLLVEDSIINLVLIAAKAELLN
jgi:hypothetical protein